MSLGERLLKYAETVITLSKALEETREHIRDIRGGVSDNRERIIRLEEKVDAIMRELDLRDQKIAAELSRQIQERLPQPKRRERLAKDP
jgi:translation initiation factor 2B subunit (eIF-2B alpha/beta/delta family)